MKKLYFLLIVCLQFSSCIKKSEVDCSFETNCKPNGDHLDCELFKNKIKECCPGVIPQAVVCACQKNTNKCYIFGNACIPSGMELCKPDASVGDVSFINDGRFKNDVLEATYQEDNKNSGYQ